MKELYLMYAGDETCCMQGEEEGIIGADMTGEQCIISQR
jgi:hypothetical protein